jgi:hypothetical protein
MIDTLYINGCSWSAGDEIECDALFEEYLKKNNLSFMKGDKRKIISNDNEHDLIDINKYYNLFNYGSVIVNKLKIQNYINDALGGGSNERIVRKTTQFLFNYPKDKLKDLLVIIGWTSFDRNEIFLKKYKRWERFNPNHEFIDTLEYPSEYTDLEIKFLNNYHEDYVLKIHSEYERITTLYQQKYLLSNLLDNLNVKYLFFDVFAFERGFLYNNPINEIKYDNSFFWNDTHKNIISEITMNAFMKTNNYPIAPYLHPMIDGHKYWGEKIYEQLLDRNIIDGIKPQKKII